MNWSVVLTTFGLIFVAELGDKTQLAVLAQTCKHRRPWAVFLGAALALAAVTALGAAAGQLIGRLLPPAAVRLAAASVFVVMGVFLVREAARPEADELAAGSACALPDGTDTVRRPAQAPERLPAALISAQDWKAFSTTFGLLFVAEMGDKTQLAVLGLAGKSAAPLPVFLGGALALIAVTALGVIGGQALGRIIPKRVLLWISAAAFVVMGVLIGFGVL